MVSNYALLAMAIAVVQVARALGSPMKEFMLFCVCMGVLIGGAIASQVEWEPGPGPKLPEGWRWHPGGEGPEVLAYPAEPPADPANTLGFAIVPGNPGVPHFYCRYAERLHRELEALAGPTTMYVVGYPNFATKSEPKEAGAHIDSEAEAISAALACLNRAHSRKGLALFGHSIGAWVVAQYLGKTFVKADSKDAAPHVPLAIFAMPYLEFYGSWKQRLVSLLARLPGYRALARFLTLAAMALPASVHDLVCPLVVSSNAAHCDTAKATLLQQAHHLMGMLLMVRSEVQRLDPARTPGAGLEELAPLLESAERPPVLALFTRGDIWSPECHAPRLRTIMAGRDDVVYLANGTSGCVVEGKPPSHSFILDDEFVGPMASLVADRVAREMTPKGD